jgi:peptidoglycan/xylan/chitin deacetylase (PgdA/CDA1 family)
MRAILTYHSIDSKRSPISLAEPVFRRHAAWLAAAPVRVLGLAELVAARDAQPAAALTFDDAYSSFLTTAWPVLREHGLPATVFVVAGHVAGTNTWGGAAERGIPVLPLLDWDELGRLAEEGVALGVHSRTHPHLAGISAARLEDETLGAKQAIERRTGARCAAFAYPYGTHDAAAVAAARAHFDLAVTTELRTLAAAEDRHLLPRVDAWYLRAPGSLEAWGTPAFGRRLARRRALRALRSTLGRRARPDAPPLRAPEAGPAR